MSARRILTVAPCLFALCFATSANAAVDLPNGAKLEKVDFERHVMGLFGDEHQIFRGSHGRLLLKRHFSKAAQLAAVQLVSTFCTQQLNRPYADPQVLVNPLLVEVVCHAR